MRTALTSAGIKSCAGAGMQANILTMSLDGDNAASTFIALPVEILPAHQIFMEDNFRIRIAAG